MHDEWIGDRNNGKEVWAGKVMMTEEYGTSVGTSGDDEVNIPMFQPSEKPFIQYEPGLGMLLPDGALLIQCDGSCVANSSSNTRVTIGVFCGEGHKSNYGGMVPIHLPQTNQMAKLTAVSKAITIGERIAKQNGIPTVVVASDSEYACSGLTW